MEFDLRTWVRLVVVDMPTHDTDLGVGYLDGQPVLIDPWQHGWAQVPAGTAIYQRGRGYTWRHDGETWLDSYGDHSGGFNPRTLDTWEYAPELPVTGD